MSQQDTSNEYPQHMFFIEKQENIKRKLIKNSAGGMLL